MRSDFPIGKLKILSEADNIDKHYEKPATKTRVKEKSGLSDPIFAKYISELEEEKYIEIKQDADDKRRYLIKLTEKAYNDETLQAFGDLSSSEMQNNCSLTVSEVIKKIGETYFYGAMQLEKYLEKERQEASTEEDYERIEKRGETLFHDFLHELAETYGPGLNPSVHGYSLSDIEEYFEETDSEVPKLFENCKKEELQLIAIEQNQSGRYEIKEEK